MKGLRKIIFPFAPDQSGAVSVFYELGGMIVICDAGGCAGNICGFDEPRWFEKKSAVFSAGLRDMDAILGRDDQLVQKIADAAHKLNVRFAVVIGTPVPATIATDYHALKRMIEKKCSFPVMTISTNGIRWYDEGAEAAYLELMKTFAEDRSDADIIPDSAGILGATPLDLGNINVSDQIRDFLKDKGITKICCYGMGSGLDDIKCAGKMEKNLVIAPSGLKAAKYLKKRFGTPYEACFPIPENILPDDKSELENKKILIIHQQVRANALRQDILDRVNAHVDVATWFMLKREWAQDGDVKIKEEDQFIRLVQDGKYDLIFGDPSFYRAIRRVYHGRYIGFPHFAVSGTAEN